MRTFAHTIAEAYAVEGAAIELGASVHAGADPKALKRAARRERSGDAVTDFLGSHQGKAPQRQVVRGIFGMLRKGL